MRPRTDREGIGRPILIGHPEVIQEHIERLGLDIQLTIVDPDSFPRLEDYAQAYYEIRQRKGVSINLARQMVRQPNLLGSLMVKMGDADAFVSGLTYDYPEVIRPALQVHHTRPDAARVCGVYIMIVNDRVYLFTDATVKIDPTSEDLVEIACLAANFARQIELEPRVAFLSFSNFGSTPHPLSEKVRKAVELLNSANPTSWSMVKCRQIRQWFPK